MSDERSRALERRNDLLDRLERAEKEWGDRLETKITKEAAFFKRIIDRRTGAGAATGRIQDRLAELTVDKIGNFLTGGP